MPAHTVHTCVAFLHCGFSDGLLVLTSGRICVDSCHIGMVSPQCALAHGFLEWILERMFLCSNCICVVSL